jgi:hypothetical protein
MHGPEPVEREIVTSGAWVSEAHSMSGASSTTDKLSAKTLSVYGGPPCGKVIGHFALFRWIEPIRQRLN